MAYCSIDDVKAEFKTLTLVSDSANGITEPEIIEWIDQASAMIDAQVSNCFVLPIQDIPENSATLLLLKNACVWLVADRIIPIIQVKTRDRNLEQTGQDKITYYMKAKSILNKLCPSKESGLSTPAKKESSVEVDFFDEQETFFERDLDQW